MDEDNLPPSNCDHPVARVFEILVAADSTVTWVTEEGVKRVFICSICGAKWEEPVIRYTVVKKKHRGFLDILLRRR